MIYISVSVHFTFAVWIPSFLAEEVPCLIKIGSNRITLSNEDVISEGAVPSDLHNRGPQNMALTVEHMIIFNVAEEGLDLNIDIFCA